MTGWSGSGYGGPQQGGGPGRSEDDEATVVRPTTPPTAPGGYPPPPPVVPNQGGWGAPPPAAPQPGYGQAPPAPGYPAPPAAPGHHQAPPPPSYPPTGPGPAAGYGDLSGHLQRAGYGQPAATPGVQQPTTPGPRRRRKPLIVGILATVVLLVVAGLVLNFTVFAGGPDSGKGSAGDVVKGYLEALARGDAEAALSYSDDQPGSKDLLSDEILKKQIAEWPITDIRILNDDSSAAVIGMAQVHVTAKFGDKTSDATLQLKKSGDRWRLGAAAIKLSATPGGSSNEAAQTMTIFGKDAGEGTLYVFPGYLEVASGNKYLDIKQKDPLLLEQLSSYSSPWLQTDITLNSAGNKAVLDRLKSDLDSCRQSHSFSPPAPCPVKLLDSYNGDFVTWGSADTSRVKIQNFDPYQLQVSLFGELTMDVTTDAKVGTISPFISATADLSKTPPTLKYR
jgi:hypothetical protein